MTSSYFTMVPHSHTIIRSLLCNRIFLTRHDIGCTRLLSTSFSKNATKNEDNEGNNKKDEKPKMSNKLKVTLLKAQKKRASNSGAYQKMMKGIEKKENTQLYNVHEKMSVKDLAKLTNAPIDILLDVTLSHPNCKIKSENSPINDREMFNYIASKMKCKFNFISTKEKLSEKVNLDVVHDPPKMEDLVPRPPVVAIVGHIDHGKTTLLDRLRKSNVVETEFGRITQHIGAFSVSLSDYLKGSSIDDLVGKVTFLDTPGHAAFKNMRVRGALITDIVILVVDAVEGPLEQTLESIDAVRKARVSMIVAINKIDKPNADIDRTKKVLYEAGVQLEEFGGDIQAIHISALNGTGVEDLIEAILAQSEILQLSADPKGPVEGSIVESNVELGLGKTATVLVKRGTLKKGQFLVCGLTYGRVKQLLDTRAPISEATAQRSEMKMVFPSETCRLTGWKELPNAGDVFLQVESEKRAQEVIRWRKAIEKEKNELDMLKTQEEKRRADYEVYKHYRFQKLEKGNMFHPVFLEASDARREVIENASSNERNTRVSVVIKTDVNGSLEAIEDCLKTYDNEEVFLDIAGVGVGEVTENDVKLANDCDGIVYSFNASVNDNIRKTASYLGVTIKEFNVVYALIDDLKEELSNKLPLLDVENVVGTGSVGQEFLVNDKNKQIPVAGCHIKSGSFNIEKKFKVMRGTNEIFIGGLSSLKHFKDEKPVVTQGKDCGVMLEDSSVRFNPGDQIICFEIRKERRHIEWATGF